MEIIKTKSSELTKIEMYKMTHSPAIRKMKDVVGSNIDVIKFLMYKDMNARNEEVEILSIMDNDGTVYATNSASFKKEFELIEEIMDGEPFSIEVISGTSKAGRTFITCALV